MSTDILISFDTTGSMAPCLSEVRRKVATFVDNIFASIDDLRIGVITHGDYCDGAKVVTETPFTNDKQTLIRFIETAPRTSGGDSDECYEYVMARAITEFAWRSDAKKAFILIADAQPHEVGYTYNGKRNTLDWRDLSKQLVNDDITVYPVQCLGSDDRRKFYQTLARDSGTPVLPLAQFTDIVQLLTAVIYQQESNERVEEYATELETMGQLNRNLASMINSLLGKAPALPYMPAYAGDLVPVDPSRFQRLHVDMSTDIKSFVQSTGATFRLGKGFYQLTKREEIQPRKEVVLVDKSTGDMFSGKQARELIKVPYGERGKIGPENVPPQYDAYVQSTSVNRKLMPDTMFLYEVNHV